MGYDPTPPNPFNPMMLWADLGLRALDMSVSSAQNVTDGVERITRANASPESVQNEIAAATSVNGSARPSGVALAAQMHRNGFDLMTQGWLTWMSTLGSFATLAAGRGFGPAGTGQATSWAESAAQATKAVAAAATTTREESSGRSNSAHESRAREHAVASAEPRKRRSNGGGAKRKRKPRNA